MMVLQKKLYGTRDASVELGNVRRDVLQEFAQFLRCDAFSSMYQNEGKEVTVEIHQDDIHMCRRVR